MSVLTITDPIVLLPIRPAPLPYNYRFSVQFSSSKIPKQAISIGLLPGQVSGLGQSFLLADQDTVEPCGFSTALCRLLKLAEVHNLWGQTLQLCANYPQRNGVIATTTQSPPQSLRLPRKPVLMGSAKDRIDHMAQLPGAPMPPPRGLRLFWTQLPSFMSHDAWFVGPDNRLAEATNAAAFDRFSFWISALGLPIKTTTKIQTGEAFAKLIKADGVTKAFDDPQPTVSKIVAAASVNPWLFDQHVFWNATRLLFYWPGSGFPGFHEYGLAGFSFLTLSQFGAGQDQNSRWNLRFYLQRPQPVYGLRSVA